MSAGSNQGNSSPTPRPALASSCLDSSRTSSMPSSSAASCPMASSGCAAPSAATTSCWRSPARRRQRLVLQAEAPCAVAIRALPMKNPGCHRKPMNCPHPRAPTARGATDRQLEIEASISQARMPTWTRHP